MSGQRARVPSRQALLAERFLDPERGQPQPRLLLGPLGPLRGWAVAGWGMPPLGAQWRRPAELSPTPWSPDDAPKVSSEWGWKGPDAGPRPAVGGRASGPPRSRALGEASDQPPPRGRAVCGPRRAEPTRCGDSVRSVCRGAGGGAGAEMAQCLGPGKREWLLPPEAAGLAGFQHQGPHPHPSRPNPGRGPRNALA